MSIRKQTPCDFGECPYNAEYNRDCEYWCGEEPEEDYLEDYDAEEDYDRYLDAVDERYQFEKENQ